MPNQHARDNEAPDYVTPAEAERIAFLGVKQLSRLADAGRIAFIRPGKHRRYLRSDVEALVSQPQITSVPEATPPAVSVAEAPSSPVLDAVPDPGVEGRGTLSLPPGSLAQRAEYALEQSLLPKPGGTRFEFDGTGEVERIHDLAAVNRLIEKAGSNAARVLATKKRGASDE
jgi:hypothetical protein